MDILSHLMVQFGLFVGAVDGLAQHAAPVAVGKLAGVRAKRWPNCPRLRRSSRQTLTHLRCVWQNHDPFLSRPAALPAAHYTSEQPRVVYH
ncbi:MAG: hypothetical protein KGY81_05115 [Phycisphaerae bacterium]|nr:hypothetical protein [Phycisphaerae bacterium]